MFTKLSLLFSSLLAVSGHALSYSDVAPTILRKCAVCHKGPVLDLTTYPLYSQTFPTPRGLATEIVRRLRLDGWKKMPPVNGAPLTADEQAALEKWFMAGMPR
jgi:uncharacterized membrane protein